VVWTDVIQIMLMYGTLLLIVIKGTLNVGGLSTVIERNAASGRFEAPEYVLYHKHKYFYVLNLSYINFFLFPFLLTN
jgi:Na+/proline symporter